MSIAEIKEIIEEHKKTIVLGTMFFLVGTISFALGYLSAGELRHPQIVIEQNNAPIKAVVADAKETASIIEQVKAEPQPAKQRVNEQSVPIVTQEIKNEKAIESQTVNQNVFSNPVVSVPENNINNSQPAQTENTSPSFQNTPANTDSATVSPAPIVPIVPEPVITPPVIVLTPIQITEVLVGTEASADDEFIELYNPNSTAIDLTGYSIKKKVSSGSESTLVAEARLNGKSIPAGKHFLIGHEDGYLGGVVVDASWAKSNTLAYTNNSVILYDKNGVKTSEVNWTELAKGMSTTGQPSPQNSLQ